MTLCSGLNWVDSKLDVAVRIQYAAALNQGVSSGVAVFRIVEANSLTQNPAYSPPSAHLARL